MEVGAQIVGLATNCGTIGVRLDGLGGGGGVYRVYRKYRAYRVYRVWGLGFKI